MSGQAETILHVAGLGCFGALASLLLAQVPAPGQVKQALTVAIAIVTVAAMLHRAGLF